MKALPTEVPEMDNLDYVTLVLVSEMAAGMSKEEIFDTLYIKAEDLDADEKIAFAEFYQWGRGMAVHKVVKNLIESSKGKGGQQAAMAFLRRFAKEFEGEVEGDTSGSFSFTFGGEK